MSIIVTRRVTEGESEMFAKFPRYFKELARLCSDNFWLASDSKTLFHYTLVPGGVLNLSLCQICAKISATFSLNPDRIQNKEDTLFISIMAYCVYIPISRPILFCPHLTKISRKIAEILLGSRNLRSRIKGFLSIFMGFKSFHQTKKLSYKTIALTTNHNVYKCCSTSCFVRIDT